MNISEPAELLPRPRAFVVAATLLAVTTTYLALRMPGSIRRFQEMFREFGVSPTSSTELVFSVPDIWWLFAAASIALLVWIAIRSRVAVSEMWNMKMALIATVALTALVYGFAAFAIYTPLFRLADTV